MGSSEDPRSHRDRMLAGERFQAFDPEVRVLYERAQRRLRAVDATGLEDIVGRRPALAQLVGTLGEDSDVSPPLQCDYGINTHLGTGVVVNFGAVFIDTCEIRVGDQTLVGPGVQLLTADHPLDAASRRAGWESGRPFTIGENAWLGGGAVVLRGVSIGDDAVGGAGSVVTRDVAAGTVVVGNPARPRRRA